MRAVPSATPRSRLPRPPTIATHVLPRSRAALLFGAATLAGAIGVGACNPVGPAYGGPPPPDTNGPVSPPVAAYGAPAPDRFDESPPIAPPAPRTITDAGTAPKPKK